MKVSRKPRKSEELEVRGICGYVAIRSRTGENPDANGWLYLRQHSDTELFVGNLPQPPWFSVDRLSKTTTHEQLQGRIKAVLKRMVPGADAIGDVFSTGNGRLATRIAMQRGEAGVQDVLRNPADHLYVQWERLCGADEAEDAPRESVVDRWLREYQDARDERAVKEWSNAAMKAFELREKRRAEEKERREREGAVADEDGFVLVTSGAKQMKAGEAQKVGTRGKDRKAHYKSKSSKNRKMLLDAGKGIEKAGFYRWQRENKNTIADLQNKFKEDQKRIGAIRALGADKK